MKARMMKAALVAAGLAVAILSSVQLQAAQNRKLDFTLVNKTGLTIEQIYVSPSDDDEWGEDVMGKDVLDNGESVDIEFSRKETTCSWDLKIVYEKQNSVTWTKLNLCTANEITLRYENKKPTAVIK